MKNRKSVSSIIWQTIKKKSFLSAGIVFAVAASVVTALLPPLILGKVIDMIRSGASSYPDFFVFWADSPDRFF